MMSQLNIINNALIYNIIPPEIYKTESWNKVQQKYSLVTEDEIDPGCWWSSHKVKIKLPEGWKWKYKKPLLVLETEQGKVIFSHYYDIQQIR